MTNVKDQDRMKATRDTGREVLKEHSRGERRRHPYVDCIAAALVIEQLVWFLRESTDLLNRDISQPEPTGSYPSERAAVSSAPISASNHSISRIPTAAYTRDLSRMMFLSLVETNRAKVLLSNAITPTANARRPSAANPTPLNSAWQSESEVREREVCKGVEDGADDDGHKCLRQEKRASEE